MSDKQKQIDDGGPAYPLPEHLTWHQHDTHGMSLRDYFAAKAMQGMLAYSPTDPANGDYHTNATCENTACAAYAQADAMLSARKQSEVI